MTAAQVEAVLGCDRRTFRRLVQHGDLNDVLERLNRLRPSAHPWPQVLREIDEWNPAAPALTLVR
jgi:hypothetical protein